LAFKENCPDLRNTRVIDVIESLRSFSARVDVHDPWVDATDARNSYGLTLIEPQTETYEAIVIAVGHDHFRTLGAEGIRAFGKTEAVVYDVKSILPAEAVDGRL